MFTGIHHVALAVRRLEHSLPFYRDVLGLPVGRCEAVQEQGVRAALLPLRDGEIELLEPMNPAGGVARFLEKRGEGLHHLCIATTDIDADLAAIKTAGLPLIDQAPRQGLAGRIGFLHPNASGGILVELAQPAPPSDRASSGAGIGAVALETVYAGIKDPAAGAETFVRTFAGRTDGAGTDPRLGLPAVSVRLGRVQVTFLRADDVAAAPFHGRPEGLLGVCVSVGDLEAVRRSLASGGTEAEAVGTGPEPGLVRLDPARTNGMTLFLVQA